MSDGITDMMRERVHVYGIGLPRTGTTSLKAALRMLMEPEFVHVGDHMCLPRNRYRDIDVKYPDAKFIFTKRESGEKWLSSVRSRTKVIGGNQQILQNRERMYGSRSVIPELYLPVYYKREVDVLSYFMDKYGGNWIDKLLVVCWEEGDGWPELCSFLGLPVPDVEFPHRNKSKQ